MSPWLLNTNSESQLTEITQLFSGQTLSEVLVRAGPAAAGYLEKISRSSAFQIAPFDERAAVEVAVMTSDALSQGDKRGRGSNLWQKVKFDRQIVAIAKVSGANTIYSNDPHIYNFGTDAELKVLRTSDLPLPDALRQGNLALDDGAENE